VFAEAGPLPNTVRTTDEEPDRAREGVSVTQEEIFGKVKDLVSKQLSIDEKEITSDASFIEDLGADSLDTVELIMSLEEEFDIEIPDEEAEKIKTVQNVVDYIQNHLNGKEKAS
jgi:acyl carrier protein